MTVKEYLHQWLEDYARFSVRRSTYESYVWSIEGHIVPRIGQERLRLLQPLQIQKMLSDMARQKKKLSATSIRYTFNVLSNALGRAVKWQMLTINPCLAVEPPRKEKFRATAYNKDELNALLDAAKGTNLHLPIILAAACGLRRGEVCALRWQDLILEKSLMFVRHSLDRPESGKLTLLPVKTARSERSVKMPQTLVATLRQVELKQKADKLRLGKLYADKDFVFAWDNGEPVDPDYLNRKFRGLLKESNLKPLRFHDLRHTHATLLLLEHVAVKVVSERLGHSSTNITQDIYSHVLPEMQQEAADAIDRVFEQKVAVGETLPASTGKIISLADRLAAKKSALKAPKK